MASWGGLFAKEEPAATRSRSFSGAQQRCDEMQAVARAGKGDRIRRGVLAPVPLVPSDDMVDRRLAEEIDYAKRLLAAMGERLAGDPLMLSRHGGTLQGFDIVEQMLGHLASVAGVADRRAAIDRIGMEELRTRMKRKGLDADGTGGG